MAGATKVEFDVLANDKASAKLDKVAKSFDSMGKNAKVAGNGAAESIGKLPAALSAANQNIAKLSKTLATANDAAANAADRLKTAQIRLNEVQGSGKAKASQLAAAEDAVAAAQRKANSTSATAKAATEDLAAAQVKAKAAADDVAKAQANAGAQSAKLGAGAGKNFSLGFSKSLGKLGGGISKTVGGIAKVGGAAAIGAGVAIGAAFIGGMTKAMDTQEANHLLASQLGLTGPQSAKAGKIAGDLYKNAYGDSVSEVNGVLKEVFQNGLATVNDSAAAIKGVSTQVMNFAKIAGEEALPVTRAVSQMLKTGLAKNATEAFDILTRGQQLGINKSQDLLDTFNEYGTQFRKIGLDGPTALGLMSQALKGGARDSDLAADSLKEFSIRAIDGSKTTVDAFTSLGLSAKGMQEQIAGGGPKAAAGLGIVLDKLRSIKDPAEQSRIAVELFGTQAEDMGKALFAMDTGTAVAGLGKLKGAAADAGDTLNNTAKGKFTSIIRTIKTTLVDAISKYALPSLESFADWFAGPGQFVAANWAIAGAQAMITLSKWTSQILSGIVLTTIDFGLKMTDILDATYGKLPGNKEVFKEGKKRMEAYRDDVSTAFGKTGEVLDQWNTDLETLQNEVKFKADIADLEAKLKTAKKQLEDKNLTKERRAQIQANIKDLEDKLRQARGDLASPALTATKIAKLQANKTDLDAKIKAAQYALSAPSLTATKRASLQADIKQLLAAKAQAQAAINALTGKTVYVQVRAKIDNQLSTHTSYVPGRAVGGPVRKNQPYVVGEHRAELFIPNQDGTIMPSIPKAMGGSGSGGGGTQTLRIEIAAGDSGGYTKFLVGELQKYIRTAGGNVQVVLGKG